MGFSSKLWEFKLCDTDVKLKEIKKRGWFAASSFHTESAWNPARAFVDITNPRGTKEMVVFRRVSSELVFYVIDKLNQLSAFADWKQFHQQEEIDDLKNKIEMLVNEVEELREKIKTMEKAGND